MQLQRVKLAPLDDPPAPLPLGRDAGEHMDDPPDAEERKDDAVVGMKKDGAMVDRDRHSFRVQRSFRVQSGSFAEVEFLRPT